MDKVWLGAKVPDAFIQIGKTDNERRMALNNRPEIKRYLVELAIVSDVRDELLENEDG